MTPPDRPADRAPDAVPTAAEARAEVEARRAEVRAERAARFAEVHGDTVPGRATVVLSWVLTVALAALTAAAVADPDAAIGVFFVAAMAMFFGGSACFAVVLVLAAGRSRSDALGIGGLFFLAGCAPPSVQRQLLGSLAVAVVVSVLGAALRPFTPLAFGTLAPTVQLALCGWWAVRHGVFPPRADAGPTGSAARGR